jgi:CheY-like chemotaxis protein
MPCVVVAGDSSEGRQLIAGMLRDELLHIVGAPDGDTVLELVQSRTAELLLMDTRSTSPAP